MTYCQKHKLMFSEECSLCKTEGVKYFVPRYLTPTSKRQLREQQDLAEFNEGLKKLEEQYDSSKIISTTA
jgi:hypothetical protein